MHKKVIAAALIAIMGALTLSIGLHTVLALENHINGYDYSYWDWFTTGGNDKPWFCECYHTDWENTADDMMVGLSLQASYYTAGSPNTFNWGDWIFEDEAGGGGGYTARQESPLYCTLCTNGNNYMYYNYYSSGVWGTPPLGYYNCWYVYYRYTSYFSPVSSVEGRTLAQFYYLSNPSVTYWYTAYTQNPPGQSGNGWAYLTAHVS